MSKHLRLKMIPIVASELRPAYKKAFTKLRDRSLQDITWAEESYALSTYRGLDPADKTLKYFLGDAPIKDRSPWFPHKKLTCWITLEFMDLDGNTVRVEMKPPLWHCSEN